MQTSKVISKKLKLNKDATEALILRLAEAQMAYDLQHQLPVTLEEKVGKVHEALTFADARVFGKDEAEHLIACLKSLSAADLAAVRTASCLLRARRTLFRRSVS